MVSRDRTILKSVLWILLGCSALFDGALGEAAISGCCDVSVTADGRWILPAPRPGLWVPICLFVMIQGLLVFGLLRLRSDVKDRQ